MKRRFGVSVAGVALLSSALLGALPAVAAPADRNVTLTSQQLKAHINQTITIAGYLITRKRTSTSKGDAMFFGTFIDTQGIWIDTVHFPQSAAQYPFTGPGCYELRGKVVEEYDFMSLEVEYMKRLETIDREAAD